ncbi:MAG TPA: hypothetical protein VMC79_10610, partial [Rectinemataceae bacterium]|nr:hypothetical protein [Rectinemataceae bacterium]
MIAFVGAGGKTSGRYLLAGELGRSEDAGRVETVASRPWSGQPRILLSSTTKLYDPRFEPQRPELRVELEPALGPGVDAGAGEFEKSLGRVRARAGGGAPQLLASARLAEEGKLLGVAPEALCTLAEGYDCIVV